MSASADNDPLGAFSATAEQYAAFVRRVSEALADAGTQPVAPVIDKLLEQLRQQLDGVTPQTDPVAAWLGSVTRLFAAADANVTTATPPFGEWADEFWSIPLLGPGRDWQRLARRFNRALIDYAAAQTTQGSHYRRAMAGAIDAFREEVLSTDDAARLPLADLHRRWTDIADRCYREVAMSEDFSRDFGNAINQTSALRQCLRDATARLGLMFGFPDPQALHDVDARIARLEAALRESCRDTNVPDVAPPAAEAAAPATAAAAPANDAPGAATTVATKPGSSNNSRRAPTPRKPAPATRKRAVTRKSPSSRGKTRRKGTQAPEFDVSEFLGPGD